MSNDDMRRALPASISAEQSVLGALLLDNDAIDRIGDLKAEHFFRGDHKQVFAAVVSAIEAGKPADPITISDALPEIGVAYLNDLAMETPSSANIGRYAELVVDRAQRRGLLAIASDIETMTLAEKAPPARELIDSVQGRLDALADTTRHGEPVLMSEDLGNYVDEIERRRTGLVRAVPTGFADLDRKLSGGLRRGEVVVVGARPKIGKSLFAMGIACNAAADHSVLVLSMEMPRTQLHDRNVAAAGRIELGKLLQPELMTEDDWQRMTTAIGKLSALTLWVDDQPGLRLLDVRTKARQVKRKRGLDLLVIDYLQLMDGDGDNRNEQIGKISRGIKSLAKELNIAIVLLSQLNRGVELRPNKRPGPADLRDSGSIEQDLDVGLFLYRDEYYNPDTMDKGILEVIIGLNRQGATGTVGLAFVGDQTRLDDLELGVRFGHAPERKHKFSVLRD